MIQQGSLLLLNKENKLQDEKKLIVNNSEINVTDKEVAQLIEYI